jgi:two-component system chemotaxis sensor kinase CheA
MLNLRGELCPIFRLNRIFNIAGAQERITSGLIVVVDDGQRRAGLFVDELLGQFQVVSKTLGAWMGKVAGIAGGAILGDGQVGLILDLRGVLALSRGTGAKPGEPADKRAA